MVRKPFKKIMVVTAKQCVLRNIVNAVRTIINVTQINVGAKIAKTLFNTMIKKIQIFKIWTFKILMLIKNRNLHKKYKIPKCEFKKGHD